MKMRSATIMGSILLLMALGAVAAPAFASGNGNGNGPDKAAIRHGASSDSILYGPETASRTRSCRAHIQLTAREAAPMCMR